MDCKYAVVQLSGVDNFYWVSIVHTILPSFTLPLHFPRPPQATKNKKKIPGGLSMITMQPRDGFHQHGHSKVDDDRSKSDKEFTFRTFFFLPTRCFQYDHFSVMISASMLLRDQNVLRRCGGGCDVGAQV
jgi:hypothetical protein